MKKLLPLCALVCLLATGASAVPVSFAISGHFDIAEGPLLHPSIPAAPFNCFDCPPVPFTGTITLDSSAPNTAFSLDRSRFRYSDSRGQIEIRVGDISIRSDPLTTLIFVDVANDYPSTLGLRDGVSITSFYNVASTGEALEFFDLSFDGPPSTFENPVFPSSAALIPRADFQDGSLSTIDLVGCPAPPSGVQACDAYQLRGVVTSITDVPEPEIALMLGLAGIIAARKR